MQPRIAPITPIIVTALLATPAFGQFVIAPAQSTFAGTQPSGIAYGDYDQDGDVDVATTADGPDRVAILFNDGTGQLALGGSFFLPASSSPQDVISGDFDGDGDPDLAVAVRDPQGSVVILRNMGGAAFTNAGTAIVGERPRGLSAGDYDGDGDIDLAVANRDSDSASVLTNNGSGTFSVMTIATGAEPRHTAFGDFDADGDLDLAVTNHDDRTVATFTNGGGGFTLGQIMSVGPFVRPDGIASADLDNDGDDDLAVATSDQTLNINQATLFLAGGGFSGPFNYATGGSNTSDIALADLDCDGLLDVIAANKDSGNVSLLRNMGAAVLGAPQIMAAGLTPGDVEAADLDGDADPDFAVASSDGTTVSVFINDTCQGPLPCPGDIDGDGFVTVEDMVLLITAWGPNPGHPADIDGDGSVGVTDLIEVISGWGTCP